MYKVLNKMAPEPHTKLFTCKNEITNHKIQTISTSHCVPQPRTNNMKTVPSTMVHTSGILFQAKQESANPFPFSK